MTGVATGIAALDELTGGLQPANLILATGPRRCGKSAFALSVAVQAAASVPVVLCSLQLSDEDLVSHASGCYVPPVTGDRDRLQDATSAMSEAAQRIRELPLLVFDRPRARVAEICAACRAAAIEQGGLGLIVVDQLELVRADACTPSRIDALFAVAGALKALAREVPCPVLVTAEHRWQPSPLGHEHVSLADLRSENAVSWEADLILAFNPPRPRWGEAATITVLKHRDGARATFRTPFQFLR